MRRVQGYDVICKLETAGGVFFLDNYGGEIGYSWMWVSLAFFMPFSQCLETPGMNGGFVGVLEKSLYLPHSHLDRQ